MVIEEMMQATAECKAKRKTKVNDSIDAIINHLLKIKKMNTEGVIDVQNIGFATSEDTPYSDDNLYKSFSVSGSYLEPVK